MDDHQSFENVYRATFEQILGYAMRRCETRDDAMDVVAETYTIAWRRIDRLPDGDQARLWLYAVARNVLANHRRSSRRLRARETEIRPDIADDYNATPSEQSGELSAIGRVFRALSDDDRELLSLVAWEGLDAGQIARITGRSRNAVRIRLHRARKRFVHALREAGVAAEVNKRAGEIPARRSL